MVDVKSAKGRQVYAFIEDFRAWVLARELELIPLFLLGLLVSALFSIALQFVPAVADDLVLLSSAANTPNPLVYFVADAGLGYGTYRPLHSVAVWLMYRVFGVSAFPGQLLNLILHFIVVCLLYRVIQRVQPNRVIAFLLTALTLASIYTMSAASWVSDRPTLIVAICLLLTVNHLLPDEGKPLSVRIGYIAFLAVFALLGKESGLIVPLLALFSSSQLKLPPRSRLSLVVVPVVIIGAYLLLRVLIFGSNAVAYRDSGYLFGLIYYPNWDVMPGYLHFVAAADNIIKNLLAPILPLFSNTGALVLSPNDLWRRLFIWLPTVLLFGLAASRNPSLLQRYALAVILASAVIHFAEFRYRLQYSAQIAFCLYVASSPRLKDSLNRQVITKITAVILLFYTVFWINRSLNTTLLAGNVELNLYGLQRVVAGHIEETGGKTTPIDPQIVEQVLERYRDPQISQ